MSDQWLRTGGSTWLDALLYDTVEGEPEPLIVEDQDSPTSLDLTYRDRAAHTAAPLWLLPES